MIYEEKDLIKCISLFVDVLNKQENRSFLGDEALSMGKEILSERGVNFDKVKEPLLDMDSTLLH